MSEKLLKVLKKALKDAVVSQSTAVSQKDATEGYSNKIAIAVNEYVTEELKAAGIQYNGAELPANVVRKGDLDGTAKIALNSLSAKKAIIADTATYATAAGSATTATIATTATTATTALTASYVNLIAGPNITINTNSNGGIAITGSAGGGGSSPEYWTSLVNNNIFTTGSAVIRNGLIVTGSIYASHGFSGSLTRLESGKSYLVAGPNITINTASNGSVEISGSASSGGTETLQQAYNAGSQIFLSAGSGSIILSGAAGATIPLIQLWPGTNAPDPSYANAIDVYGSVRSLLNISSINAPRDGARIVFRVPLEPQSDNPGRDGIGWLRNNTADLYSSIPDAMIRYNPEQPALTIYGPQSSNNGVTILDGNTSNQNQAIAKFVNSTTYAPGSDDGTGAVYFLPRSTAGTVYNSGSLEQSGSARFLSNVTVTGSITATTGFSGSLTKLKDGTHYLVAGPNITINTASNGSVEITGSAGGSSSPIYWTSTVANIINTTGSVVLDSGNLSVTGSISVTLGFTGSLFGTASYAVEALTSSYSATASYVLQAISASYASTASYLVDAGFSGSITRLKDGTPYLLAGPNITITTNSNGSIAITGSAGGSSSPIYWTSNVVDNIFTTGSVDITGSLVTSGSIRALTGFSGSLTKLANGSSYLVAGPNITINTASNGSVEISGSASGGSSYWTSTIANRLEATSSLVVTGSATIDGIKVSHILYDSDTTGTSYGTVIKSAGSPFGVPSLSFIHGSNMSTGYVGSIQGYPSEPGFGIVDGLTLAAPAAHPNVGIRIGSTGYARFTTSGLQVTGSIFASDSITAVARVNAAHVVVVGSTTYGGQSVNAVFEDTNYAGTSYGTVIKNAGTSFGQPFISFVEGVNIDATSYCGSVLGTIKAPAFGNIPGLNLIASATYPAIGIRIGSTNYARFTTSGLQVTGSITATTGFSGSLTKLADGSNYLVAGPNITINTASNGSVEISGSNGSSSPSYWNSNISANIFTTGSIDVTGSLIIHAGNITVTGSIISTAGFFGPVADRSSTVVTYSINPVTDQIIRVATTASNTVLQLPNPSCSGSFLIKKTVTGSYTIALSASIGEKIEDTNGLYTLSGSALTTRPAWQVWSDGTNWWIA